MLKAFLRYIGTCLNYAYSIVCVHQREMKIKSEKNACGSFPQDSLCMQAKHFNTMRVVHVIDIEQYGKWSAGCNQSAVSLYSQHQKMFKYQTDFMI